MEKEKEGEKHQCVVASCVPLTGDLALNPGMCPDWELRDNPLVLRPARSPLSHTSQGEPRCSDWCFSYYDLADSRISIGFCSICGFLTHPYYLC